MSLKNALMLVWHRILVLNMNNAIDVSDNVTDTVTLTVDGIPVTILKGANLIEAAQVAGVEIPHYCYHKNMSIAGNCRMCQVEVEGMPKLTIACNTEAKSGMVVRTHRSSNAVMRAQQATLEFLLVNHPLDCTVCDQAGHCKLQDYYHKYSSNPSRFIEEKVNKLKAKPLGKEIIYDGERCILCTRCVRFCREVVGSGELGVLNRGDKSVIDVYQEKELSNPFSGTVADLCPVGALTHRRWRFNSRIWYAQEIDTICVGCSTGCNVRVAVRDNTIVHVKARQNENVNKEWLCDEGRYGFDRFVPKNRLLSPLIWDGAMFRKAPVSEAVSYAADMILKSCNLSNKDADDVTSASLASKVAVFISPMLTLEEMWATVCFCNQVLGCLVSSEVIAMPIRDRLLSEVEKKLISPDYAPNARAFTLFSSNTSDWREVLKRQYNDLIDKVKSGECHTILLIGDYCVIADDVDDAFRSALLRASCSIQLTTQDVMGCIVKENKECFRDLPNQVPISLPSAKVVFPSLCAYEKTGVFVNKDARLQSLNQLMIPPSFVPPALMSVSYAMSDWKWLRQIALTLNKDYSASKALNETDLFRIMSKEFSDLHGIMLPDVGHVCLEN